MNRRRAYLETSFICYLAPALEDQFSPDLNTAHRQLASRAWWEKHRNDFAMFISDAVYTEVCAGEPTQVRARLKVLGNVWNLEECPPIREITGALVEPSGPLPKEAIADAAHLAFASTYECEYLLTWSYRYLANAGLRRPIEQVIATFGYVPSIVCTPEEVMADHLQRRTG